jgi:hypothetical protein
MAREDEQASIDSLVQYLRRLPLMPEVSFRELPRGDDPPDFWMEVGDCEFAVEVTAVTSDVGYSAHCGNFHSAVKEACRQQGGWQGAFAIEVFRRPGIPKRNSKEWKKLITLACSTIEMLLRKPAGSECILISDTDGRLKISKLAEKSDFGFNLGLVCQPEGRYEGEAERELVRLITERISTKKKRIDEKKLMSVCPNVVLILFDAYGYCEPELARSALLKIPGFEWLHSVFWAASFSDVENANYSGAHGRLGCFLFTKEDSWRG